MSEEQRLENGANFSLIHIDFMIGGPDTEITARFEDGHEAKIFAAGNWAL